MITKPERLSKIDITKDDIIGLEYCTKSHDYCKYVKSIIKDLIDNKKEINNLLHRYFKIICSSIECWTYDYDNNLLLCMSIFDKFNQSDLSDYAINKIIESQNCELFLLYIGSMDFTIVNVSNLLNLLKYARYSEEKINMYNLIIEKCINSNSNELIQYALNYTIDENLSESLLEKLLDLKLKPSDEKFLKLLVNIIDNEEYLSIIKKCILNGIIIERNLIKNFINYILQSKNIYNYYRINHFSDICIYFYDNGSTDFTIDNIIKCSDKIDIIYTEKFLNHIINNDYNLTKEEFKLLCSNKICIKNKKMIEKFLEDQDIKELIFNFNLNYKINLEYTLNILKNECGKKNNIIKIKEILKTIKPDQECLEIVCKVPNNMSVIKLIHNDYNIPFNEKCILNYSYDIKYNSVLSYIRTKIEDLQCDKD
jgi:hypothetical protein